MPIQVSCPSCKGAFKAPDSAAGKKAKCPKCGGVIEIPVPAPAEEVYEAEEAPPRPFDEDDFEVEPPPELPKGDDRKACPMCGELIQRDAVKCRFCGEVFDPVLKAKNKGISDSSDTDLSIVDWLIAIFAAGLGCIVAIIYLVQGKPKGTKMLLVSLWPLYLYGVLFIIGIIIGIINAVGN